METVQKVKVVRPHPATIQMLGHHMGRVLVVGKDCSAEQAEMWIKTRYVEPVIEEEAPAPVVKKGRRVAAHR
jgi:hypothetical protein